MYGGAASLRLTYTDDGTYYAGIDMKPNRLYCFACLRRRPFSSRGPGGGGCTCVVAPRSAHFVRTDNFADVRMMYLIYIMGFAFVSKIDRRICLRR